MKTLLVLYLCAAGWFAYRGIKAGYGSSILRGALIGLALCALFVAAFNGYLP